jgi:S-adenosylmethionine:tRNA ribosyltransferase-isomerase
VRRDLLDYELPPELIASRPPAERDGARLLIVDPAEPGAFEHAALRDLDRLLALQTLVVVNDTRVLPARLIGRKAVTGGRAEIFLLRHLGSTTVHDGERMLAAERWRALGKASKDLRPGGDVLFDEGGLLCARILARISGDGLLEVALFSRAGSPVGEAIESLGAVPLPPYIRRAAEAFDRERYQTVFARVPGAVAAPTAGLHLSPALLERFAARDIELAPVTLHVGLGTFQPVVADDLDDHRMHAEQFDVPAGTVAAVARARARGAPVVAIGTTVVRALESAADPERPGFVLERAGETRLLIQPGTSFRVVDQLVTNFHLPRSTLLALVFAFGGRELMLRAYRAAIEARYRFYSYGDAMWIRGRGSP